MPQTGKTAKRQTGGKSAKTFAPDADLTAIAGLSAAEGFLRKTAADTWTVHKSNLSASAAPGVADDSAAGYSVGSHWIDTAANTVYICTDSTVGAAQWKHLTGAGGGLNNVVEDTTPQAGGDFDGNSKNSSGWVLLTAAILQATALLKADTLTAYTAGLAVGLTGTNNVSDITFTIENTGTEKAILEILGRLQLDELSADPATPATGRWNAYFKSDGLYYIDDLGVVTGPLGAGGGGGTSGEFHRVLFAQADDFAVNTF